jgi:protein-S-isoprenylcysteine O-methyltransferase Ste14
VRVFKAQHTVVDPRGTVTNIVRRGPYAFTRNPMYLSLMLIYVGGLLAFRLEWAIVWLVPVFLMLHFGVIRPEERYMQTRFGEDYRRYVADVRRWI